MRRPNGDRNETSGSIIQADYSPKLDSMMAHVRGYLATARQRDRDRAFDGLAVFCFNNTAAFTNDVRTRVGVGALPTEPERSAPPMQSFVERLLGFHSECIFLLRDTYPAMRQYQARGGVGFGMLVNRRFLCRKGDEEDYFELVAQVYDSLGRTASQKAFLAAYVQRIDRLCRTDEHWQRVAVDIARYVDTHVRGTSIVWVDWGAQFTFSLFSYASVALFGRRTYRQSLYNYTVYPWLEDIFRDWYFSRNVRSTLPTERRGRTEYQKAVETAARGAVVGFAIGDSLGFPAAGMEQTDVRRTVRTPITSFATNTAHPYFSMLRGGQYTDNTTMLLATAAAVRRDGTVDLDAQADALSSWGRLRVDHPELARWPGPTAMHGARRLLAGAPPARAGSTTSRSCSALYRVLPVALSCRPFVHGTTDDVVKVIDAICRLTHRSEESRVGCRLFALLVADLLIGCPPALAVDAAIARAFGNGRGTVALNLRRAARDHTRLTDDAARRLFGTSSAMAATLPLAVTFFLKYTQFGCAVTAAANSFRVDPPAERRRLAGFSWARQMELAHGGNTDGIAAVTGALVGATIGSDHLPRAYTARLEDREVLEREAERLVRAGC